jgi:ATP-dependent Clp protease ATP-binding subunit ClpA
LAQNWEGGQSTFANILLKILDKGKIRNNRGEEIDFTRSIIILTGNLGATDIIQEFEGHTLGFRLVESGHRNITEMSDNEVKQLNQSIYKVVKEKAERELAPEFLNRLDRLVVFHFLTRGNYDQILELELDEVQNRINKVGKTKKIPKFVVTYSNKARKAILDECVNDRSFGARALKRVIEKRVVTPLAELLNNDLILEGDHLEARVELKKRDEDGKATLAFFRLKVEESPLLLERSFTEKSRD